MRLLGASLLLTTLAPFAVACQQEVATDTSTKPAPAATPRARHFTLEQDNAGAPPISEEELNRLLDALEQERDSR
ncbi:MAG TPA: hypothetical protein VEQ58_16385 [Polyangiaceae bacterium]|nr:hypothetical protein [Polyangiaceae bacterium]